MFSLSKIDFSGSGGALRRIWHTLSPLPGGRLLFSRLLGLINPYTGALGAEFLELEPGYARARLRERRAIQNHLRSVHAIALMNLAEVVSGLPLMAGLPDDARGIPVHLDIDYHSKARGVLFAECRCDPPATSERQQKELTCSIRDDSGQEVATAHAHWIIGPRQG